MIEIVIASLLVVVGLINFFPSLGMASASRLSHQYDLPVEGPDLSVLMRHRALMLGIIGAFIIASAFLPDLRPAAYLIGFSSMLGFVIFARANKGHNQKLAKISAIDTFASVLLLIAVVLHCIGYRGE